MAEAARASSSQKKGVTWAQMARDVLIAAMNKGQLPTLILMFIAGIVAWRLPPGDLTALVTRILRRLEDGTLAGWLLCIVALVCWYLHSRKMRRQFSEEYERIGNEKSRLQSELAGKRLSSSKSSKPR